MIDPDVGESVGEIGAEDRDPPGSTLEFEIDDDTYFDLANNGDGSVNLTYKGGIEEPMVVVVLLTVRTS